MSRPEARPIARPGPLARRGPAAALAALALLTAAPAAAHDRATSRSRWTRTDEGAEVRVRLRVLDVSLLRAAGVTDLDAYLQTRLSLEDATGHRCTPGAIEPAPAGRAFLARRWTLRCEGAPAAVRSALLLEAPTHLHVAALPGGRSALLDRSQPRSAFASSAPASVPPHLGRAVLHGARHIVSGPDHLLFLALLLVFATRLRELAGVVTGFTLGHSATLAAAALGAVSAEERIVEALIGASIAIVAVENVWRSRADPAADRRAPIAAVLGLVLLAPALGAPALGLALFVACHFALLARGHGRRGGWRAGIAALFGGLHGLGFAGAIAGPGPVSPDAPWTLFGFNLGVELAQLALVLLAWPLLQAWRQCAARPDALLRWTGAAGVAAGVFWTLTRSFG